MIVLAYRTGMLDPRTSAWASTQDGVVRAELGPADDAYFNLLATCWAEPGDLLVVEHDMLPTVGVVDEMLACRWPWCASPYEVANRQRITDGLGCTKFSATLKQLHPSLMQAVGEICDDGLPAKNWRRLDTRVARMLRARGLMPHLHTDSLHLHDYRVRP